MPHWRRSRRSPPGEQSFEAAPYKIEVTGPDADLADAALALRHAQEQIALANQYPGRTPRAAPRAEVIALRRRR